LKLDGLVNASKEEKRRYLLEYIQYLIDSVDMTDKEKDFNLRAAKQAGEVLGIKLDEEQLTLADVIHIELPAIECENCPNKDKLTLC